ncbi:MAG: replicative DNA helicase [Candidatus Dormibacteraeota bacterium]|nr:replicative DNA helicase [Candidatus Dormibacteraeota bacterium]
MQMIPLLGRADGRVPPHDLEAEGSVLGAILLDQAALSRILDVLQPEDFYRENHGQVYRAALSLFREGEPIDNVTVAAELEKMEVLERVGGRAQLALLQESVPTAANVEYYARIVKDRAYKRRLISAGGEVTALGFNDALDAEEAVNQAQSHVYAISDQRVGSGLERLYDLLKPAMDRIDAQMATGGGVVGIASGFHDLDRMTNGFKPSDLIVVAGRPAMGKALALDTPIPTPTGWTTMGALSPGDQVFDDRGRPATVLHATPVQVGRDCYEVLFSDGARIVADADHRWSVLSRAARKFPEQRNHSVLTTIEMASSVRADDARLNYCVRICEAIQYPRAELPLDPYVLGVWLGDGNSASALVTPRDTGIIEHLAAAGCATRPRRARGTCQFGLGPSKAWAPRRGTMRSAASAVELRARVGAGERGRTVAAELAVSPATVSLVGSGQAGGDPERHPSVQSTLRALGVLGAKHIPRTYLQASVDQRLALLQGLMDTDGSIDNLGHAEYVSTVPALSEGVLELVTGLGLVPRLTVDRACLNGVDPGSRYRVRFKPTDFQVFRLARKAARQRSVRPGAAVRQRFIREINRVESVPVRCLQVDAPSHLYLAGRECIPTHNTSFILNVALNAAVEQRQPIAIFSLEMSKEQLVERMLCEHARIDAQRLHRGILSDVEYDRLARSLGPLGDAPIFIDDSPMLDDLTLRLKARQARTRNGIELILLDYLQLMHGRSRSDDNRVQEVSAISRSLKGIARELRVPVIAISQLSRAPEARPDKRPILSDLRESGSIEQDADIVMFLYRDDYYNRDKSEKPGIAEVIVSKHRNGPTGMVELMFRKELTRFENLDRRRAEPTGADS